MTEPTDSTRASAPVLYEPPADADEVDRLRDERDFWKHLFEDLVESFPEPVVTIDDEGRIVHWNEAHEEHIGLDRTEVVGRRASDVIGTENVDEILADEIVRTDRTIREDEVRSTVTADGERWHVRAAGQPLRAPDGTVVGAFEYVTRVTDLVEKQQQVERVQSRISDEVETSVSELLETSERVARSSQLIGETTDDQVARLSEVSDEVTKLSATIEQVAASAEQADGDSERMEKLAVESKGDVAKSLERMEDVSSAANELTENATALESQFSDIENVIEVINDIAGQINLLALNASIEAARSGEAGSGFAVVADEIKSLAEQTSDEVETIEDVIDEMATVADATTESVRETTAQIDDAMAAIRAVDEKQDTIRAAIENSRQGIGEIATATDEQAASAAEVSSMVETAVDELEGVAGEIGELAAANETVTEEVRTVQRRVRAVESELDAKPGRSSRQ
ncbi:methyl-accepting chemotaxis protein [Natrarchaeobius oligotrophus]|uniref:Methyl-accepting chemotaxis protein n=1 Tax=Natrarchaeobius chitinivorans TaxID=1679083 RepID=A0A3N6MHI4_NATCH|nr:methyl-accepting chemotaxis protein [Natrarchaeobius chitinivorans]RQH02598.1 methyl-accepting chemotaxis protein [Natrarchaeobius chitinivorans]